MLAVGRTGQRWPRVAAQVLFPRYELLQRRGGRPAAAAASSIGLARPSSSWRQHLAPVHCSPVTHRRWRYRCVAVLCVSRLGRGCGWQRRDAAADGGRSRRRGQHTAQPRRHGRLGALPLPVQACEVLAHQRLRHESDSLLFCPRCRQVWGRSARWARGGAQGWRPGCFSCLPGGLLPAGWSTGLFSRRCFLGVSLALQLLRSYAVRFGLGSLRPALQHSSRRLPLHFRDKSKVSRAGCMIASGSFWSAL